MCRPFFFSMNSYYLVRHAHACWTEDENRPLSASGQLDAARACDLLRPFPIDLIFSSPYRRAIQTVNPLANSSRLSLHIAPELRERRLGTFPEDDFQAAVRATWRDATFAHQDGESNRDAQLRARSLVDQLETTYESKHIVLSTHGNLLALLLRSFDQTVDFTFWRSLSMPDIYTLTIGKQGSCDINRIWSDCA